MRDRVTITDVARQAGVSRQTVSRVINGKGEISDATAAHVRAIIEQLGFRPSSIARSLATQRTLTLGLIVPDISNPFFADVARGAEDVARGVGYSILQANTIEDPRREAELLEILEDKRVDGLLLCSSRLPDAELRTRIERHHAVVLVNRRLSDSDVGSVRVDYEQAAMDGVAHLCALGRLHIGFLAGPPPSWGRYERVRGYESALLRAGIGVLPDLIKSCLPYYEDGCRAALELLGTDANIDALFCFNDLVAAGALRACQILGRRVPDDIAVVGTDDILLAALVSPPLTTLRVGRRELGESAMQSLLDQINHDVTGQQDLVYSAELVVRASTIGPAAAVAGPAVKSKEALIEDTRN